MGTRFKKILFAGATFGIGGYLASYLYDTQVIGVQTLAAAELNNARKKYRREKRPLPSRADQIKSLKVEEFDILIVGGGATGAGCALDAVSRGQ